MAVMPIEISVTPMRGDAFAGKLVGITTQQVTIQTAGGTRTLKTNELLILKLPAEMTAPLPLSENVVTVVTLTDGSVLHALKYTVTAARAQVSLLDGTEITIPTRAIDHVRLKPQTPATVEQWREILQGPRKSDAVVIRNTASVNDGPEEAIEVALDAPEVVLGDIDDSTIGFEFDESPVKMPRSRVHGVIYYHRRVTSSRDPICRVTDATGSRWHVSALSLKEDGLHGVCVAGFRFTIPIEQVTALDYSIGNIDYLSDLPRESVVWRPRRVAGTPPSAHRWYSPKFDRGLFGVLKLDDETYEKGLALHSHGEVSFRLTKRYRSLLARVGVDDGFRYEADLELKIYGDNEVIFSRRITGRDEPFDLELDMQGIRRLKIVVGYGKDNSERGDNLNLCNARLTK
jgi:hypothetical protein